jgi:ATP-dependent RNA helicase DeaD
VLLVPASRRRKAEMLLSEAKVEAVWAGPPTQDEIRALDQERLLQDPLLSGETSEDDAGMVEALLAGRSAPEIAAALVRVYRSRLPAAEEVGDPNFGRDERRPARGAEAYAEGRAGSRFERDRSDSPRADGPRKAGPRGETVWFRLNIGRKDGADPRQLLPMLCRRGKITRDEVGAIRIFDKETKVEIDADVAERFAALASAADRDKIVIEPVTGEAERRPAKPFAEKASHGQRHQAEGERGEAPFAGQRKPYEGKGKPFAKKPYDPTRRDREPVYDENAVLRPGERAFERKTGPADRPFAKGKPHAGAKPFAGKPGGGKSFGQGKSFGEGKSFGQGKGPGRPETGYSGGPGGKPPGKPFNRKKPRRDDRG